jgi:NAD(P)-dependent dehydrogenase (short-subunit alcohol dehydrogenase family)
MTSWLITGASKGFGRIWAEAALERGDRVALAVRDTAAVSSLTDRYGSRAMPLQVDVTDRGRVFTAVQDAAESFGELDVMVNNAGYGLFGFLEETTEEQFRAQVETNLFGTVWGTQAATAVMREQGHGHIVQVTSFGGIVAVPHFSAYVASKWAVEGLSEALAKEIAPFGVAVTMVEPSGYDTNWGGSSAAHTTPMSQYDHLRPATWDSSGTYDPHDSAAAMLALVDSPNPPLRVAFGRGVVGTFERVYRDRVASWREHEALSDLASGYPGS